MKVCTVIGARPQFIKAAVVSRAFAGVPKASEIIIHTGQHYDANMSDIFFDELKIPRPDYNLGIGGGSHGQNTGRMIEAIETILLKEKPDLLLVYGDTDSTLSGALSAQKIHIPVAHVEAGLRSYNRRMPEEMNRVLTDHISSMLFVPTATAIENLAREGIAGRGVHIVGDVMYDAAIFYSGIAKERSTILSSLGLESKNYILATLHRAENTNDISRLAFIFEGLSKSPFPIILPLHPRTKKILQDSSIAISSNIRIINPVGYLDMVTLEKNAVLIATDSGGVQKEAYFYNVPCLTLRDETEWTELVSAGANILVGADAEKISYHLNLRYDRDIYETGIYGDAHAGDKIVQIISEINIPCG